MTRAIYFSDSVGCPVCNVNGVECEQGAADSCALCSGDRFVSRRQGLAFADRPGCADCGEKDGQHHHNCALAKGGA